MEYVCPDPKARVRAANVRATLEAFTLVPALGKRIIESHDLKVDDLRPDNFILVQSWLDALKEIEGHVGPAKVRQVGRNIVEAADIPEGDTESILLGLDHIFYMNHRGDVGHYITKRLSSGAIEVRCETPYPRNFEWGLVEGFCLNKCARGKRYAVEFIDGVAGTAHTCSLIVSAM